MKVLIVGSWVTSTYEEPLFQAMKQLADVHAFKWAEYFGFTPLSNSFDNKKSLLSSIWSRFQNKYLIGPAVVRLNRDLLRRVEELEPDLVFLYRATHIWPSTVKRLKEFSKVMVYNNDDPFSDKLPAYVYRHYLGSLQHADWIFSYREKNIEDYLNLGFTNTSILRSNYLKNVHYPIEGTHKKYDLTFIGHFENDGRDEMLVQVIQETKCKLGLWGHNWEASKHYEYLKAYIGAGIGPIFGDQYNLALNESKIALVFFSKINSDGYTRRCFEIPASKTFMLCEHAPSVASLFQEGTEAEYFRDPGELTDKVRHYLSNDSNRIKVATNGYQRLLRDGHEIKDRAKQIIETLQKL